MAYKARLSIAEFSVKKSVVIFRATGATSANDPKRASSTHIFSSSFCVTENGSGRRGEEGIKSLPHNRVAFA